MNIKQIVIPILALLLVSCAIPSRPVAVEPTKTREAATSTPTVTPTVTVAPTRQPKSALTQTPVLLQRASGIGLPDFCNPPPYSRDTPPIQLQRSEWQQLTTGAYYEFLPRITMQFFVEKTRINVLIYPLAGVPIRAMDDTIPNGVMREIMLAEFGSPEQRFGPLYLYACRDNIYVNDVHQGEPVDEFPNQPGSTPTPTSQRA